MTKQEELRDEARAYITECLAAGIPLDEIEQPSGLLFECRMYFGKAASIRRVAGDAWIAALAVTA